MGRFVMNETLPGKFCLPEGVEIKRRGSANDLNIWANLYGSRW